MTAIELNEKIIALSDKVTALAKKHVSPFTTWPAKVRFDGKEIAIEQDFNEFGFMNYKISVVFFTESQRDDLQRILAHNGWDFFDYETFMLRGAFYKENNEEQKIFQPRVFGFESAVLALLKQEL